MLVTVCAWCERFLGMQETEHDSAAISHGICRACSARHRWAEPPTLVVCRLRSDLLPVFREILRGEPEIHVVVDRRQGERRHAAEAEGDGQRRFAPRRRATPAIVC